MDWPDSKNMLIVLLLLLLILSILGVNVLFSSGQVVQDIWQFCVDVLKRIGFSAGEILNASSTTVTTVAKTGLDITDGALHDVGNLLEAGGRSRAGSLNPNPAPVSDDGLHWCLLEHKDGGQNRCDRRRKNEPCESGKTFADEMQCQKA